MREKQEGDDARMQKFREEKAELQLTRIHTVAKLADERSRFEADFRSTMHRPDTSEGAIKRLAQKFNLDMEAIAKKVYKRPATAALVRPQTRQSRSVTGGSTRADEE
jgi:hypothetical protein